MLRHQKGTRWIFQLFLLVAQTAPAEQLLLALLLCVRLLSLSYFVRVNNKKKNKMTDNEVVNNVAWAEENKNRVDVKKIDKTFGFVLTHHPLHGLARRQMPKLTGTESTEELAKLADAVTVLCVEAVGSTQNTSSADETTFSRMNATGVGNLAYCALKHSDEEIRRHNAELLEGWRVWVQGRQ
jgi:hypothetical protein